MGQTTTTTTTVSDTSEAAQNLEPVEANANDGVGGVERYWCSISYEINTEALANFRALRLTHSVKYGVKPPGFSAISPPECDE